MNNDNEKFDLALETPVGKVSARNFRSSDLIGLCTLLGVTAAIYFSWQSLQTLSEHAKQANTVNVEIAASIKDAAKAQRMMTCILSVSQEKREQEFMSPNGFCKQMSMMP
jgi:hypothetical protein